MASTAVLTGRSPPLDNLVLPRSRRPSAAGGTVVESMNGHTKGQCTRFSP